MSKPSSALTVAEVDTAYTTIKCILNNRKIQLALKNKDEECGEWLKNLDEQVALKISMEVLMQEGARITLESP